MHITQRNIIRKLMYADSMRYSEIKPKDMSGNQFKYHLDTLLKRRLVEKGGNGYMLTGTGKNYIEQISQRTGNRTRQPKTVAQIIIQNQYGQYLMHKQERQPFAQTWNLPYAKINFFESPTDSVKRICARYGIYTFEEHYLLSASIIYQSQAEVLSSQIRMVFAIHDIQEEITMLHSKSAYFSSEDTQVKRTPGVNTILDAIQSKNDVHYLEEIIIE